MNFVVSFPLTQSLSITDHLEPLTFIMAGSEPTCRPILSNLMEVQIQSKKQQKWRLYVRMLRCSGKSPEKLFNRLKCISHTFCSITFIVSIYDTMCDVVRYTRIVKYSQQNQIHLFLVSHRFSLRQEK